LPPSPPTPAPLADILPEKLVASVDQTTTSPPSPLDVASAVIVVAASIEVFLACWSVPPP
jgi:hypothetical protein